MIRLPIPIFKDDKIYREIELKRPTLQALLQAKKTKEQGNTFKAFMNLFKYCITAIDDINDNISISGLIPYIPIMNALFIAQELALIFTGKDKEQGIEGMYQCPFCDAVIRAEKTEHYDTRDFLSQLEVVYYNEDNNLIHIDFCEPVVVTDSQTKEEILRVDSIDYTIPTLADCEAADNTSGQDDFEIAIFAQPLKRINGEDVDQKFLKTWARYILLNINDAETITSLNKSLSGYGLKNTFEKTCKECGKVFNVVPKTTNFFDYTLRSLR